MRLEVTQELDTIIHNLEVILKGAKDNPAPILHVNADALVVEYTDKQFGAKMWERVADLQKNNS